ncbi:uncharacterized protein RSE6_12741 [Rhynchosporium secalis]|uniref:Uncharacterized protein n=1 Tax=Rhynchosporium secalis TaxID=38038 RepID=A0A1E1MR60_RHYSE|nr:uncharacterized protein RSE6_12741 [Rhynchosporium secalis]
MTNFARARKAAQVRISKSLDDKDTLELSPKSLAQSYSLFQLHDELVGNNGKQNTEDDLSNLLILRSCLEEGPSRLQREDNDEQYITRLSVWISKSILPTFEVSDHDSSHESILSSHDSSLQFEDKTDSTNASRQKILHIARRKGILGLQSLFKLLTLAKTSKFLTPIPKEVLVSILAFTSTRDIWSTPTSLSTAEQLLALPSVQKSLQAPEFVSTDILHRFVRPLFSASKPRTVTAAGRKAMPSTAPLKRYDFDVERASRPWLHETVYTLAVLEWAVGAISPKILETSWPLLLPPLLTLLDTPGTSILTRGLSLIITLLPKLSPKVLAQSGLASVFSDAIIPTTLYLPSITPLEESLQILPLAYEALFVLYDVQYASLAITPPLSSTSITLKATRESDLQSQLKKRDKARLAYLDTLIRRSIFSTYLHASQHPSIVSLLLKQLTTLIPKLGIHTVKHLKDIFPILASVLTDPFAAARLEDIRVALEAFRVLLKVCWVRIREVGWRREGVKMLVICWSVLGQVDEDNVIANGIEGLDGKEVLRRVRGECKVTGQVFAKAVGGKVDLKVELKPLLDVEEGIEELFGLGYT